MRYLACLLAAAALCGCSWETYQNDKGRTTLRPKYESGTRIYYEDGTYSQNMRNNRFRPEQHAVKPDGSSAAQHATQVRGTHWQPVHSETAASATAH